MEKAPEDSLIIKQKKTPIQELLKVFIGILVLILWAIFEKDYQRIRLPLFIITGIGIILAYVLMYKFPYTLTLTSEGFQLKSLVRGRSITWNSIEHFQIKKDTIVWSYIPSYSRSLFSRINRSFMGFDDNLPKNFEMEPEDLVNLLNEWKKKHTKGYTYETEITGNKIAQTTKEFIDANPTSITSFTLTWMFIIFPTALLFILFTSKPSAKIYVLGMVLFMFIFIFGMFLFYRKRYVSRIIIDSEGITFYGLLKKIQARWSEIMSVELYSAVIAEVKTRNGNFLLPLTMKDKYKSYPKINKLLAYTSFTSGLQWVDAQGKEKPITLENCPLYKEMQIYLSDLSKSKLIQGTITESQEEDILKKGMTINWIIWCAMLFSLMVYVLIGNILTKEQITMFQSDDLPINLLKNILYVIALAEIISIYFLRKMILRVTSKRKLSLSDKQADLSHGQALNKYSTALIISSALAESIGIYGLILFFLGNDMQALYLFNALAAFALLIYRPRKEELKKLNLAIKRIRT